MRFQDLGKAHTLHFMGLSVRAIHAVASILAFFVGILFYAWTRLLPLGLTVPLFVGPAWLAASWSETPAQGARWRHRQPGAAGFEP